MAWPEYVGEWAGPGICWQVGGVWRMRGGRVRLRQGVGGRGLGPAVRRVGVACRHNQLPAGGWQGLDPARRDGQSLGPAGVGVASFGVRS